MIPIISQNKKNIIIHCNIELFIVFLTNINPLQIMKGIISKSSVVICFLFLSISVFSQTEERPQYMPRSDKHRNVRDELGRKQGLWKYYSTERILLNEITFLNDVKHGLSIRHNSSTGIVTEEANYFNGKRDGEYKRYNYLGTLITEGQYLSGRREGAWTTYYVVNGEKRTGGSYSAGQKEGIWSYYSAKGKVKAEGEYKSGLRDGTWVYYNSEGTQSEEKKFKDGKEVGVVTTQPGKKNPKFKGAKKTTTQPTPNPQGGGNQGGGTNPTPN